MGPPSLEDVQSPENLSEPLLGPDKHQGPTVPVHVFSYSACPAFSSKLVPTSSRRRLPQKDADLLEKIRVAKKLQQWDAVADYEEQHELSLHKRRIIPPELNKSFLRSLRAQGPFRKDFDRGSETSFKKGELSKLKSWDAKAIQLWNEWHRRVGYWQLGRAVASDALGPALAKDLEGNLTTAAKELEAQLALVVLLQTYHMGVLTHLSTPNHPPSHAFRDLPLSIARATDLVNEAGGLVAWNSCNRDNIRSPFNLFRRLSWTNRKQETFVRNTARC